MLEEETLLGSGSFGEVVAARWQGQRVAVKKIHRNRFFENEVRIQQQCDHENLVKLFMCYAQDNYYLLVMELMQTENLFLLIHSNLQPIDPSTCLTIAQDIVAGLHYLHGLNFLHRDIKPANVLFNARRQAKLADFGCAIEAQYAHSIESVGTLLYFAPELAFAYRYNTGFFYSHATDIFALGITLLELVLGKDPYPETDDTRLWGAILAGKHHKILPNTPLNRVITKCLASDADKRLTTSDIIQFFTSNRELDEATVAIELQSEPRCQTTETGCRIT